MLNFLSFEPTGCYLAFNFETNEIFEVPMLLDGSIADSDEVLVENPDEDFYKCLAENLDVLVDNLMSDAEVAQIATIINEGQIKFFGEGDVSTALLTFSDGIGNTIHNPFLDAAGVTKVEPGVHYGSYYTEWVRELRKCEKKLPPTPSTGHSPSGKDWGKDELLRIGPVDEARIITEDLLKRPVSERVGALRDIIAEVLRDSVEVDDGMIVDMNGWESHGDDVKRCVMFYEKHNAEFDGTKRLVFRIAYEGNDFSLTLDSEMGDGVSVKQRNLGFYRDVYGEAYSLISAQEDIFKNMGSVRPGVVDVNDEYQFKWLAGKVKGFLKNEHGVEVGHTKVLNGLSRMIWGESYDTAKHVRFKKQDLVPVFNEIVVGTSGRGKSYIKEYKGVPDGVVTVDDEALNPHRDIANHSPTGFGWGYLGSGCAQLALAIMVSEYGTDLNKHPVPYQRFKAEVLANIPGDKAFKLNSIQIKNWVEDWQKRARK